MDTSVDRTCYYDSAKIVEERCRATVREIRGPKCVFRQCKELRNTESPYGPFHEKRRGRFEDYVPNKETANFVEKEYESVQQFYGLLNYQYRTKLKFFVDKLQTTQQAASEQKVAIEAEISQLSKAKTQLETDLEAAKEQNRKLEGKKVEAELALLELGDISEKKKTEQEKKEASLLVSIEMLSEEIKRLETEDLKKVQETLSVCNATVEDMVKVTAEKLPQLTKTFESVRQDMETFQLGMLNEEKVEQQEGTRTILTKRGVYTFVRVSCNVVKKEENTQEVSVIDKTLTFPYYKQGTKKIYKIFDEPKKGFYIWDDSIKSQACIKYQKETYKNSLPPETKSDLIDSRRTTLKQLFPKNSTLKPDDQKWKTDHEKWFADWEENHLENQDVASIKPAEMKMEQKEPYDLIPDEIKIDVLIKRAGPWELPKNINNLNKLAAIERKLLNMQQTAVDSGKDFLRSEAFDFLREQDPDELDEAKKKLLDAVTIFSAGPSGSGKTTSAKALLKYALITYMTIYPSFVSNCTQILLEGFEVLNDENGNIRINNLPNLFKQRDSFVLPEPTFQDRESAKINIEQKQTDVCVEESCNVCLDLTRCKSSLLSNKILQMLKKVDEFDINTESQRKKRATEFNPDGSSRSIKITRITFVNDKQGNKSINLVDTAGYENYDEEAILTWLKKTLLEKLSKTKEIRDEYLKIYLEQLKAQLPKGESVVTINPVQKHLEMLVALAAKDMKNEMIKEMMFINESLRNLKHALTYYKIIQKNLELAKGGYEAAMKRSIQQSKWLLDLNLLPENSKVILLATFKKFVSVRESDATATTLDLISDFQH
jgi:hypothetical protein